MQINTIERTKQLRVSLVLVSAVGWYAHVWYMSFVTSVTHFGDMLSFLHATTFPSVSFNPPPFLACARLSVSLFFVSFFAGVNGCVAPLYQSWEHYSI